MSVVQPFLLQNSFDCLIDSFIENKVGISESFLTDLLASDLKQNLLNLYADEQMRSAGIGNNDLLTHDKRLRSDKIYWLDRAHENIHENLFFDLMDTFVAHLNRTCFTGITGYEFHYAMYEKGSFYKKHFDQFRNNKSRVFSMIMYLNVNWEIGDGGELCIYHLESSQMISPMNGKCVFFKSDELEHEVLLTQKQRLSITGWLKVD
jgi:SM-20-related protein